MYNPGSNVSYDKPIIRTSNNSLSFNARITGIPGPGLSILFSPVTATVIFFLVIIILLFESL